MDFMALVFRRIPYEFCKFLQDQKALKSRGPIPIDYQSHMV